MSLVIPVAAETEEYRLEHRRGTHRQVHLVPTPFGSKPAIWTSPYEVVHDGQPAKICIVLVTCQPAETMRVTVPTSVLDRLPQAPVEW